MSDQFEEDEWMWIMDYCRKKRIPPAQLWAWEEAKKAYTEMKKLQGESKS